MERAGALSAIQFAVVFLAAIGAILVAGYTNLPTGFRIGLGVALFGFAVCLMVALIPLLPASLRPTPKPDPPPGAASTLPPLAQASQLQERHETRVVDERRAIREVREELRDNRHVLVRADSGGLDIAWRLASAKWVNHEGTLLVMEDSTPFTAARDAYRELAGIKMEQERRGVPDDIPTGLLETDKSTALEAIDNAIMVFDNAESKDTR